MVSIGNKDQCFQWKVRITPIMCPFAFGSQINKFTQGG